MRRREFFVLLAGVSSSPCRPFAAFAQVPSKRPRIAYLSGTVFTTGNRILGAFKEGMHAQGYTEGSVGDRMLILMDTESFLGGPSSELPA